MYFVGGRDGPSTVSNPNPNTFKFKTWSSFQEFGTEMIQWPTRAHFALWSRLTGRIWNCWLFSIKIGTRFETWVAGVCRNFSRGGNVDILLIHFRFLTMICIRMFTVGIGLLSLGFREIFVVRLNFQGEGQMPVLSPADARSIKFLF